MCVPSYSWNTPKEYGPRFPEQLSGTLLSQQGRASRSDFKPNYNDIVESIHFIQCQCFLFSDTYADQRNY